MEVLQVYECSREIFHDLVGIPDLLVTVPAARNHAAAASRSL